MQITVGIVMTLLSVAVCVYSRPNIPNGWKLSRKNRNWLRDSSLKKQSFAMSRDDEPRECCPSVMEINEPRGGRSKTGILMDLYRDQNSTQRFYETLCRPEVVGRRCSYVSEELRPHSRCVQRYSFTYALVRKHGTFQPWRLDYIQIRSGCSCQILIDRRRSSSKLNL